MNRGKGLVFLVLLFQAGVAGAAPSSICGRIDMVRAENRDLENILFIEDLSQGRDPKRVQCGLPGEEAHFCSACETATSEETMTFLRPFLGDPRHLEWHARWHSLRARTEVLPSDDLASLQEAGEIPGNLSAEDFLKDHGPKGEKNGEDFFFMHRAMIKMLQIELAASGRPCFAPWENLPSSIDDRDWPLKKNLDEAARKKAEAQLLDLQKQLEKFRNPKALSKVSLNRFGQVVETSLHQSLHGFYRSHPVCSPEAKAQGFCDDLVPVETSPLNKYFWKIHGLIDGLVGDWLKANGYREIAADCGDRAGCYTWQGRWTGKYPFL